jgi:hypothetical protein
LGPDDRRETSRRPVFEGTPHPPGPITVSEIDPLAE